MKDESGSEHTPEMGETRGQERKRSWETRRWRISRISRACTYLGNEHDGIVGYLQSSCPTLDAPTEVSVMLLRSFHVCRDGAMRLRPDMTYVATCRIRNIEGNKHTIL